MSRPESRPENTSPDLGASYAADYAREYRVAESLQRVLLRTPSPESLPDVCVKTFYQAALDESTVGGDSVDAFALRGGRVAFVVADASGKGLAAAERVAGVRFALRAFLHEHPDPAKALSCLNDFVCDTQHLQPGKGNDDNAFVTLTLVVLDSNSDEMTCLCAGGEPPLVLRSGGIVETVPACGAALGLFREQGYASHVTRFDVGDAVLLVTDGLTEARRRRSVAGFPGSHGAHVFSLLGLDGVAQLAATALVKAALVKQEVQARQVGAETQPQDISACLYQMGQIVFEGARTFAGGGFHDDACLLIGLKQLKQRE